MTEQELQAIEARAQAATEGPWDAAACELIYVAPGVDPGPEEWMLSVANDAGCLSAADAAFIAAARTDVPALAAEVRRQREELEVLQNALELSYQEWDAKCSAEKALRKAWEAAARDAGVICTGATEEAEAALRLLGVSP